MDRNKQREYDGELEDDKETLNITVDGEVVAELNIFKDKLFNK